VILIHPWESGLDNSPPWTQQLYLHSKPWWISFVEKTRLDKVALLFRRDTQHVPPGQRLDNIDALLYYSVLQRLRRKNWDIETILNRSHFAVEDVAFNSIFVRANTRLKEIAKTIGHKIPENLLNSMKQTEDSLDKLWDGYYKQYYSRNFVTHKLIKEPSIASLLPLYAGTIPKERAQELVDDLTDKKLYNTDFPVPSVPLNSEYYKELGYWQGPTWINTNWLIIDGLRRYGFNELADHISQKSIELVKQHGAYEYFSAKNGKPAGAKNFSWSAALILDLIRN
jgi:glycogen debranching enzyme